MAITQAQKLARTQKGKAAILLYYNNAGIKQPFADLEKVVQSADSFASEPFYQRLGGMIELAVGAGTSMQRINDAFISLAKQNYGKMPTYRDSSAFGQVLVDLSTSARTKFAQLSEGVKQGLTDVANVVKVGGSLALAAYVAAGAIGLFVMMKTLGNAGASRIKDYRK